jgi:hypothetical protein
MAASSRAFDSFRVPVGALQDIDHAHITKKIDTSAGSTQARTNVTKST